MTASRRTAPAVTGRQREPSDDEAVTERASGRIEERGERGKGRERRGERCMLDEERE